MNEVRWRRIEELYHAARLLKDSARASFLAAATEGDEELRREVESLLVSGASSPGFLDEPPMQMTGAAARVSDAASLSGRRIGTYSVHERIGAGGMGEVYRAYDSKLRRDVAFKVIAADLIGDNDSQRQDHLRRFRHEAHALAALNHPNIAAIYGLEEADGVTALVMELVDGSTLAERIVQGAVPVEEALPIAAQIAEALEAAHERGIVHRDLKPANIKLRHDGTVKVLDFGLAKAVGPAASVPDVSQRATHTVPAKTATGVIVGTAAYMSPEQASGKAVDHRTDIWAFGCVLFEMLTGHAAFGGDTLTDTLAAVMRAEPDWTLVPVGVTDRLRELMRRCLRKDPRQRLQAIGDARIALDEVLSGGALSAASGESEAARTRTSRWSLPWGWAALLLVAVAALSSWLAYRVGTRQAVPAAPAVFRWKIDLPPGVDARSRQENVFETTTGIALSPDGSNVAVVGWGEGQTQLYLRSADQVEARPIRGTAGAQAPFFSPDGQWIGFWADGYLKKLPLNGGTPTNIGKAPAVQGATWLPDDTVVFSSGIDLQRVSVQDGHPVSIVKRDTTEGEFRYESPVALPGANAVLFSIRYSSGERRVAVLRLNTGKWTTLVMGADQPRFIAPGFVVVNRSGALQVAEFDTARLVTGTFRRLGEGASVAGASMVGKEDIVSYDVAAAGRSLVYVTATQEPRGVYSLDRHGTSELLSTVPRLYGDAALSPDGRQIAFEVQTSDLVSEIWVLTDIVRKTWRKLTTGQNDWQPVWRDDRTIIYVQGQGANATASWDVIARSVTGNTTPTRLANFPHSINSSAVAPNGSAVVFKTFDPSTDGVSVFNLWTQPLGDGKTPDRPATRLVATPFDEDVLPGAFSPDGRWLVYTSDANGRNEIWVTDHPAGSKQFPVTSGGGANPLWSKDGSQIFYWKGNTVMAVDVRAGETFAAGTTHELFKSPVTPQWGYDVSRDGRTFYLAGNEVGRTSPIVFVSDITANLPSSAKAR